MVAVKHVKFLYTFVIYGIANFQFVSCGDVTATSINNEEPQINSTVIMIWKVTLGDDEFVNALTLLVLPDVRNPVLVGEIPSLQTRGKNLFGDRLSGTYNQTGEHKYVVTFNNIQYDENYTFQLKATFDGKGLAVKTANIDIKDVVGSPSVCGRNLESKYTVNENRTLSLVQVICGHPKPEVKWKVGDDTFSTLYYSSEINTKIRQYRYSFGTRPFTRKDCGRNLTLVTSNTIGSMERNAEIDVKFLPSLVSKVLFYRHNASCVRVTWHQEDTGKCVINYHLRFASRETIYNTFNTYFTLCNATDVKTVTIEASYIGNVGNKSNSGITTTTSSPDITPTTNIATTNEGKCVQKTCKLNCDCQSATNVIITVVVTLVITLISITIILIISKHKGYITVSIHRKIPPQSYENRSTDDYEETGATISHYADIDTKAVKPSIYADLTTTADPSKQYAEIELHKKDTYANIKD